MSDKEPADRLTVVSQIYHQRFGRDPTLIPSRFSRDLQSRQQLYERELEATEEWVPVDCAWITRVGMLVIINHEGQNPQVHPTEEEKASTAKKILEVAWREMVDNPQIEDPSRYSWLIPPGESFSGCPNFASDLCIRSQSGVIEYTLYLIPR